MVNLLGNAIKFTDKGAVTIGASYCAELRRLVICVSDTGIGISQAQLTRLFQPFGQADSSISRRFGGTGLGLALSKRLAERLGGKLDVDSAPSVGSRFSLALPIEAVTALLEGPESQPQPQQPASLERRRAPVVGNILLAEDNPDNQRLISRYLTRLGAKVDIADNGQHAVEAARAVTYDLILMDMQMPVMDGLTAVRTLRSVGYGAAIVALTANATRDDMQACLEAGCDAFLTKPIVRAGLEQVVSRYLAPATHGTLSLPIEAIVARDSGLDDAAFDEALARLRDRLSETLSAVSAAAEATDMAAIKAAAIDLKALGRELGCNPAVKLGGQLEFAATADSMSAVWNLIDRLGLLIERVDADSRLRMRDALPTEDNGAIFSELLAEGPEMADLVTYIVAKLPEYLERTQEAIDSMDFERIGQCAHDLKSVGGGYGYPVLFELAQAMEAATAAGDQLQLLVLADRFEMLVWRIVAAADPSSNNHSQSSPTHQGARAEDAVVSLS